VRKEATVEWVDGGQDISIVYVPNVFRPTSNNPENALFRPIFGSGTSLITFRFSVFDRWGNQLFETRNTGEGWDGVLKGQEINPGVQVWYLEADIVFCGRMVHVERKGNVTIIR
jgi:gliding motility-associated-like protein